MSVPPGLCGEKIGAGRGRAERRDKRQRDGTGVGTGRQAGSTSSFTAAKARATVGEGAERTVFGTVARLAFSGILCYTVGDGLIAGGTA